MKQFGSTQAVKNWQDMEISSSHSRDVFINSQVQIFLLKFSLIFQNAREPAIWIRIKKLFRKETAVSDFICVKKKLSPSQQTLIQTIAHGTLSPRTLPM